MYSLSNDSKNLISKHFKRDFKLDDEEDFDDTLRFAIKPVSSLLICCNKSKKTRHEDEDNLFDVQQPEEVQKIVYFDNECPVSKCPAEKCYTSDVKRPQRSGKQLLRHCENTNCIYNKRKSRIDYKPLAESCNPNEDIMNFVPVGSMSITPSTTKLFSNSAGLVPKYSLVSVTSSLLKTIDAFDVRVLRASNEDKKVDFIELSPIRNPSLFSKDSGELPRDYQLEILQSSFTTSRNFIARSSHDRFILETLQIWNTEILPKPTSYSAETRAKISRSDLIKKELLNLKNELKDARVLRKGLAPPRFYTDEDDDSLAPQSDIGSVIRLKEAGALLKNKPFAASVDNQESVVVSKSIRRAIENLHNDPMYSILKRSSTIENLNSVQVDKKSTSDNKQQPSVSPVYKPSYAYNLRRIPSSSVVDNCIYMRKPSKVNFIRGKVKPDVRSDHPVFQLCEMIEIEETSSRQNLALLDQMKKERDEYLESIFVTENCKLWPQQHEIPAKKL